VLTLLVFLATVLAPASAFTIQKLDKDTVSYDKQSSYVTAAIVSNFASEAKMKRDLNRVEKVVIKVNGKKVDTLRKGKSWTSTGQPYYPMALFDVAKINGNIKHKKVGIYAYDKHNHLIKARVQTVNSVKTVTSAVAKPYIMSRAEAISTYKNYLTHHNDSVTKVVDARHTKISDIWVLHTFDTKTNKTHSVYVDDRTGRMTVPLR
jgi:hypothetical protein